MSTSPHEQRCELLARRCPIERHALTPFSEQSGFEQVLSQSKLITYISFSLFTTSNKLRAQVADVLAALCLLSLDNGHPVVLAALSDFRVAHEEKFRFEYLVGSIGLRGATDEERPDESVEEDAGIWEYRTAAMS